MIIDPFGHIPAGRGGNEGIILYSNPSGATDNITLLSDINGYKYVEIYYLKSSAEGGWLPYQGELTTMEPEPIPMPNCVGVAKTSITKDGTAHIDIDYRTLQIEHAITQYSGRTERVSKEYIKIVRATASIINKTFSYNELYIQDYDLKTYSAEYKHVQYQDRDYLTYELEESSTSHSRDINTYWGTIGEMGAPIYTIVGYR